MKQIFDLSDLDGILSDIPDIDSTAIEDSIKEKIISIVTQCGCTGRDTMFTITINNFQMFNCFIPLYLRRCYSCKTWKPKIDKYTVAAYHICYFDRSTVWDDYTVKEIKKMIRPGWQDIETIDENGNPC